MAPDDHSGARPAGPVVLRIKLRYDDVEAMVQRFASNVGKSGLFLPTRSIQPIGTEVKFELRLADNTPVLVGMGRVKYAKQPDPENPRAAFGMAIELMRVSREGRAVIIRMIERRRALGLPDVAIPLPEDLEAARRSEVETVPRGDTSGVVRDAMAHVPSVPPSEQLIGKEPASGPIGVAKSEPTRPSSPLLTSARASSGSIPVVRDDHSARVPVPVLAPERSRPRRPRVQELIEKASELSAPIIAALPAVELDMQIDLDNVLSRARELAGGDLEMELATLREAAAAPIEISVEAASAELARQLGGKAIGKRERSGSARWAPPPAIETRAAHAVDTSAADARAVPEASIAADFSSKMRAETEAAPSATIAAVVEAAVVEAAGTHAPDPDAAPTHQTSYDEVLRAEAAANDDDAETPVIAGEDYVEAFVPRAPTPVDDESLDPDTVRPTSAAQLTEIKTEPTGHRALMIDDDADVSSFERALDEPASLLGSGEYQLADEPGESTQIGPAGGFGGDEPSIHDPLAAQLDQQLAEAEAELERELAADALAGAEEEQEISELDVIAEADEEDEDLLAAHGEAEVSGAHVAASHVQHVSYDDAYAAPQPADDFGAPQPVDDFGAPQPVDDYAAPQPVDDYAARQPVDDFATRLDLGEDDEPPPSDDFDPEAAREFDHEAAREFDHEAARALDLEAAREFDAQATVAAQGDYIEQLQADYAAEHHEPPVAQRSSRHRRPSSESSYTFAENYPDPGLQLAGEPAGEEFDEPHSYAPAPQRHAPAPASRSAPLAGPDPRLLRYGRATTASTEDLEDALAALDVDFNDLSVDQRRSRHHTPSSSSPRPLPGLPIEKPATGQHPIVGRSPTGQHEALHKPRTGQHEPLRKPPTGQHEPQRATPAGHAPSARGPAAPPAVKRATKPPPIPAAARRPPTRQVPVVAPPVKRATTDDDGVVIDFDDDE